jgi:hypothetical protein
MVPPWIVSSSGLPVALKKFPHLTQVALKAVTNTRLSGTPSVVPEISWNWNSPVLSIAAP